MPCIITQSGHGDFNPAGPLCMFIRLVRNAPLAGLEALRMFQQEIFSIILSPC